MQSGTNGSSSYSSGDAGKAKKEGGGTFGGFTRKIKSFWNPSSKQKDIAGSESGAEVYSSSSASSKQLTHPPTRYASSSSTVFKKSTGFSSSTTTSSSLSSSATFHGSRGGSLNVSSRIASLEELVISSCANVNAELPLDRGVYQEIMPLLLERLALQIQLIPKSYFSRLFPNVSPISSSGSSENAIPLHLPDLETCLNAYGQLQQGLALQEQGSLEDAFQHVSLAAGVGVPLALYWMSISLRYGWGGAQGIGGRGTVQRSRSQGYDASLYPASVVSPHGRSGGFRRSSDIHAAMEELTPSKGPLGRSSGDEEGAFLCMLLAGYLSIKARCQVIDKERQEPNISTADDDRSRLLSTKQPEQEVQQSNYAHSIPHSHATVDVAHSAHNVPVSNNARENHRHHSPEVVGLAGLTVAEDSATTTTTITTTTTTTTSIATSDLYKRHQKRLSMASSLRSMEIINVRGNETHSIASVTPSPSPAPSFSGSPQPGQRATHQRYPSLSIESNSHHSPQPSIQSSVASQRGSGVGLTDPLLLLCDDYELALILFELGNHCQYAIGTVRHYPSSAFFYEMAALLGDPDGAQEIADCYKHGRGTILFGPGKRDKYRAAMYYRVAEQRGVKLLGTSWIHKKKWGGRGEEFSDRNS